jgi:GNAT superfamily N-acetyltransferase
LPILLRPLKKADAGLHKAFVLSLSKKSLYLRLFRHIQPTDEFLEKLMDVDSMEQTAILALIGGPGKEAVVAVGRYMLCEDRKTAEVVLAVRDDYQNRGVGRELLSYLTSLARDQGLAGFRAQVLADNSPMLHLFRSLEGTEFNIRRKMDAGVFYLDITFREKCRGGASLSSS